MNQEEDTRQPGKKTSPVGGVDGKGEAQKSLVVPSLESMDLITSAFQEKPAGDGIDREGRVHELIVDLSIKHMKPALDIPKNTVGGGIDSQGGAHESAVDLSLKHMKPALDIPENTAGDGTVGEARPHEPLVDPSVEHMNPALGNHEKSAGDGIDSQGGADESILDLSLKQIKPPLDIPENPPGDGTDGTDHKPTVDPSVQHVNPTLDNHENPAGDGIDSKIGVQQSLVDPSLEYTDPNPDIHVLFEQFNNRFFEGCLGAVEVKWSYKMIASAGACDSGGPDQSCTIVLSEPLLKLRPRKDLVETLLHEMIHAYLYVRKLDSGRRHHGPEFLALMQRINREAGTDVTVHHDFSAEVLYYCQHWFRCDGRCGGWLPCFAKRRHKRCPPWPKARFRQDHKAICGGTFRKVHHLERRPTICELALPLAPADFLNIVKEETQTSPDRQRKKVPLVNDGATQSSPAMRDQATQTPDSCDQETQTSPPAEGGKASDPHRGPCRYRADSLRGRTKRLTQK